MPSIFCDLKLNKSCFFYAYVRNLCKFRNFMPKHEILRFFVFIPSVGPAGLGSGVLDGSVFPRKLD